jgi:hypothetical protein
MLHWKQQYGPVCKVGKAAAVYAEETGDYIQEQEQQPREKWRKY